MGFGTPPTAPTVLEGDYSTWTEIWEYSFTDGLSSVLKQWAVFEAGYLCVHYQDGSYKRRFAVIDLSDGSNKFISTSGEHYTDGIADNGTGYTLYNHLVVIYDLTGMCFSVLGKYLIIGRDAATQFEVWKNGVKVWTSPLASEAISDATFYYACGIRYDGKYIVALTDNKKLVCFEGS